ncbi:MAG: hypothetical protein K1X86_12215 [Ignavibacteria bacterium]|nr:hypothetical protein [Ignavibacteria bacterium]
MINYFQNYFELKVLKLSDIKLHEATENVRRTRVLDRINEAKYLNNPIIVGRYDNDLILLDGANRYSSIKALGCKLIIAQIINYKSPKTVLDVWNHLVYDDFNLDIVKDFCKKNKINCKHISFSEGKKILDKNFHHILVTDTAGTDTILIDLSKNFKKCLEQLAMLGELYFTKYGFDRSESEIKITELRKFTRKKGVLFLYPRFQKSHIVKIARNNLRVPAGLTRHLIHNRVLHVRYQISKLKDADSLEKKNAEFIKDITAKIDDNKVRQYNESVIIFDE